MSSRSLVTTKLASLRSPFARSRPPATLSPEAGTEWASAPPDAVGGNAPPTRGRLSKREMDVLRLLPRGMTNYQIARELSISEPTVATHIRHIFQKTGANNRAEAAAFAVRYQLE